MNQKIKGIIYVAIGASSYGVVATFVKKGVEHGYSTAELTFAQALIGFVFIAILTVVMRKLKPTLAAQKPSKKQIGQLLLGGIPLGLTSTFYYLSLQYVPVSVCIVMLMQSVWIGSVLDLVVNKVKPSMQKLIAIVIVLFGTVLATNLLDGNIQLDWRGVGWGMLASVSYSLTFLVTNKVATAYHPFLRSMFMLFGSVIVVSSIWGSSLVVKFDPSVLWTWGLVVAFFGTVLPPLLFTKGMPLVGVGLGSIIASIELPVSVLMAYLVIGEKVEFIQWMGILLIVIAVVIMNISFEKKKASKSIIG